MPAPYSTATGRVTKDARSQSDCGKSVTHAGPNGILLLWATLGYTIFVIYGSLVPLHFQPHSLSWALERFRQIPYLDLGVGSRADLVANILLFVPLSFLWVGLLWPRGRIAKGLSLLFVLLCCIGLIVAIEFTQIFFPPRTVSLNDIVAETAGAIVGVVLWCSLGRRVMAWMNGWSKAHSPSSTAERFFYAYLFLLFGYNLLPLDLTISVVEIYHKWHEGKVLIVPFSAVYENRAQQAYALLADVAIWIPAAFLWKLSSARTGRAVVLRVLACATTIEFLQLFVYSRVTSTTDILTAGVGAAQSGGRLIVQVVQPAIR